MSRKALFSAIEARVIAWIAGEDWRQEVFASGGDIYCASASQMFHVPVEKHGQNAHLRQKGKIAELALGYGGSVGALKAMGALNYGLQEDELKPLVDAWRLANPNIVRFWWDVDRAASTCVRDRKDTEARGIRFHYQSGMMFITLPSGRRLVYVKPKMGLNRYGNESVTYEGVGEQKKWLRLESYGPKFVENIVQATARDILAEAMLRLNDHGYKIVIVSIAPELGGVLPGDIAFPHLFLIFQIGGAGYAVTDGLHRGNKVLIGDWTRHKTRLPFHRRTGTLHWSVSGKAGQGRQP